MIPIISFDRSGSLGRVHRAAAFASVRGPNVLRLAYTAKLATAALIFGATTSFTHALNVAGPTTAFPEAPSVAGAHTAFSDTSNADGTPAVVDAPSSSGATPFADPAGVVGATPPAEAPSAVGAAPAANAPGSPKAHPPAKSTTCLPTGDGYLHAHLAGAIDATVDWPNSGTRCEGESRDKPPGIRVSFQRAAGGRPNLLLVFGLTGVSAGKPAHAIGANLTVIAQGTSRIYGTLGDARCTVDSLTQRPLAVPGAYRVEARGFCTQPAHAIRGDGDVLVSTFEFAGPVNYLDQEK